MSIALEFFCLIEELTIPAAVELSVLSGVHGWGWPSSARHVRIGSAICALWKSAPSSASAADAITFLRVLHSAWRTPLGVGLNGEMPGGLASLRVK